ncbi:MAG: hypothetical protein ABI758_01140 [Candidatus Woesebacteria bacterium]
MSYTARLTDKKAQDFASKVGDLFTSVPHLPKKWIDFLVKIMPVLALIGGVLALFGGVASLLSMNPFMVVTALLMLAMAYVLLMAYKPLQDRRYDGWMLVFWNHVISAVLTLFQILSSRQGVFGLVWTAIGFYLLFELRSRYGLKGMLEGARTRIKAL